MLSLGQDQEISRQDWPNLKPTNFKETSCVDYRYNCAAWAAGVTDINWWPWEWPYFWPPEAPMEETINAFKVAYETIGYASCSDGILEEGIEKITIYGTAECVPTHVARQLSDGRWTSKLGDLKDIEHASLDDLADGLYGTPQQFMSRARDQLNP